MNKSYFNTAFYATFLPKKAKLNLTVLLLVFAFYGNVNAQCSITTNTNSSSLTLSGCGGVLYIGDGSANVTLTMNSNLNLTSLGAIQLIVRKNAGVDFGSNNYNLTLAAGSSILVETDSKGFFSSNNCSASDLIKIGTQNFASCNGGGNGVLFEFDNLNSNTQNSITTSVSPTSACGSGSFTLSVSNPPNGASYKWYDAATGGNLLSSQNSYITPLISSTTTYYVQIIYSSYSTARVPVTAIVNPLPTTPTASVTTQPTCTLPTGSVVLSGLPASGTWTLYQNGSTIHTATGGTGTYTVSGLAAGTYNFMVSNGTCTSAESTDLVINGVVTTTYNGSSWSSTPDLTKIGIINSNTPITVSADLCSCTVNAGVNAVVASGVTLKLQDKLTVNGTLTFKDSASLVQINNVTNIGNITYNRNYTGGEMDYTYWSSPVALQNLLALSPSTESDKFYSFNGTDWIQETPSSTTMTIGKGYIIRGIHPPAGPPVGFGTLLFNGVPNNGDKSITVVGGESSNLIGNPYPSAIDADTFLTANAAAIDGTLYFWTHNTAIAIGTPNPGTGLYAYSGNDYATYTLAGGVGTSGNFNDINGNGIMDTGEEVVSNRPTGKIAAGQGFFTTSTVAGGNVNFTNTMRVDGSGNALNNSNFYKTKNPKAKTTITIEKNRVWLNLTNKEGAFKQTLVGYITGATNTWDKLYDGESYDGNDFLDFYSINEDKNLTIQGRALPFDENDEIHLGYRIAVEGTFTINIDETDGLLSKQEVFLEDKLTSKTVNLKEGNYTFNTAAGTFNDRFVLRYTNKTLGKEEVELNDGIIALYSNNYKTLIIRNNVNDATVNAVELFNLLGQNITNWEVEGSEQINIQIPIKNTISGIYIVKIKTTKGEFSKKIIIK